MRGSGKGAGVAIATGAARARGRILDGPLGSLRERGDFLVMARVGDDTGSRGASKRPARAHRARESRRRRPELHP